MVPPVRWYHLLSTWIFVVSALYPIHKISTMPLNLMALVGITTLKLSESSMKSLHIILLHLLPFLWIPWDFSTKVWILFVLTIIAYFILIKILEENPFDIYTVLDKEEHKTYGEYVNARFGITP